MSGIVREVLATAGAVLGIAGYVPYLAGTVRGTLRPNPLSWGMWGLLTCVSLVAQVGEGAGPGSLVTGVTAAGCLTVCALSSRTRPALARTDIALAAGVAVAFIAWAASGRVVVGVVVASAVDAAAFVPTARNAWSRPWEEGVGVYAASAAKFALAAAAVSAYRVATLAFPLVSFAEEIAMVVLLSTRRRAVGPDATRGAAVQ